MEEDSKEILSPLLSKPQIQKQIEYLSDTVDKARYRIDYSIAHDTEILKAIEFVERFIRRKRRVCYGGQAINALLPKARQFYDSETSVPDYDFFSPTPDADVDELIDDLERAGFTEINKKVGVHEGTMKVYVNFIPVADCSLLPGPLFRIIQKKAHSVNGILYTDPDFLRMMMYLELSRPRGEVDRWKKVYERLTLLNAAYPVSGCNEEIKVSNVLSDDRDTILDFCQKHKRVVVGPEFIEVLEEGSGKASMDKLVQRGGPVIFFSHKASEDAEDIKEMLIHEKGGGIRVHHQSALTDQLFNFSTVQRRGDGICLIFQEDACHSYTILKLEGEKELRVAMPDLYLHLYYSLTLFGRKEKKYFQTSLDCLIQKLYQILKKARNHPTHFLPAFGLKCSGKQKGIATLLREKAERTEAEKKRTSKKVKKSKGSKGGRSRKAER